ncbi:MAG TPA: hypothetical protein PLN93_08360 [Vicinamibacterales bacterium]|nr:hypothetical protein [Vicinamibacterales bacterium]HOQ61449.1 hypothetical protein [Vicinamibacterales bacterium]HPK71940.1 hypothetical protein [Vicinamibacterales bacterium]HPW19890.1 hypothetical protein [Vicinamibacterales bacterium]
MSVRTLVGTLALAAAGLAAAVPAAAQPRPAAPAPDPQVAARYQLAIMADVLERAVQQGARLMSQHLQGPMPQMLFMGGQARARGFRLEGYGIFFDVDVPAMRQSLIWSWRMLDLTNDGAVGAIEALKAHLQTVRDPAQRRELDQAIRQLELQIAPFANPSGPARVDSGAPREGRAAVVTLPGPGQRDAAQAGRAPLPEPAGERLDPGAAYTAAVRDALIDAMLRYSESLAVGADEWLVVAARDRGEPGIAADDPFDVTTIQLRIRGSDLQALHAGRIGPEEARKRVESREY